MDNCEHVIDACARLTSSLLSSCANLRILATSRESIGVSGETVWRLDALQAEPGHRLFLERARQREPEFIPDAAADATIAELCERLDRLPLAIELAAARIGVMSPAEILADLEARLGALGGGSRLSPLATRRCEPRSSGATSCLIPPSSGHTGTWPCSWAVSTPARPWRSYADSRSTRSRGWSTSPWSRATGPRVEPRGTGYSRLSAEHALELLVASGELEGARERHLHHYLAVAEQADPGWPPFIAAALLDQRREDYENIRAALEWSAESDPCAGMRLLAGSRELFQMLGTADGRRLAQLLLARCPARDRCRIEVLITAGILAMVMADPEASHAFHSEARRLSAELGELELEGFATFFRGLMQALSMAVDPARADLETAIALHRRANSRVGEGMTLATLGLTFLIAGEPARARELLEQALAIHTAARYPWGEGQARLYLATTIETTDQQAAALHYRRAIGCFQHYRDTNLVANALIGQAGSHRAPRPRRRAASNGGGGERSRPRSTATSPASSASECSGSGSGARPPSAPTPTGSGPRGRGSDRRGDRARVRVSQPRAPAPAGLSSPRARGGPPGGRRPRQQGDRHATASLRAHGREPRPPRARQSRAEQPHATCEVGARARFSSRSVVNPQSR